MNTTRSIGQSVKAMALAGFAALLALSSPSSWAAGEVLEPGVEHFGKSYNELVGDWFNWVTRFTIDDVPILEQGAVDCTRKQEGSIWFLAGNFGGASNRTCTIPSGKALFIPLVNIAFWVPEDGVDVGAVRSLGNAQIDTTSALQVSIDGVVVEDPFAYRAESPPGGFALKFGPLLPAFGSPSPTPDPRDAVGDGYWILLAPLARGTHVIQFHSSLEASNFVSDVTYHVRVR
jgi:hypothetical protein